MWHTFFVSFFKIHFKSRIQNCRCRWQWVDWLSRTKGKLGQCKLSVRKPKPKLFPYLCGGLNNSMVTVLARFTECFLLAWLPDTRCKIADNVWWCGRGWLEVICFLTLTHFEFQGSGEAGFEAQLFISNVFSRASCISLPLVETKKACWVSIGQIFTSSERWW